MKKIGKLAILVALLLLQLVLGPLSPAYAQTTGCTITLTPTTIQPGEPVNVSASNIRIDDQLQTAPDDSAFYIYVPESGTGRRYYVPASSLTNGNLNISVTNDTWGSPMFLEGRVHTVQLIRDWGPFSPHTTVCTASEQVTVLAANPPDLCLETTLTPSTGPAGTTFILSALGCMPSEVYRINVRGAGGGTPAASYAPQADNVGVVNQAIQGLAAGSYQVEFSNANDPFKVFSIPLTVTPGQSQAFNCGQAVALNTPTCSGTQSTNCCPADCPSALVPIPGQSGVGNTQQMCSCGFPGQTCCPPGNGLNLPQCGQLSFCGPNNKCSVATGDPNVYSCGETVDQADVVNGNFVCALGCEPRLLPDGSTWCGCGFEGGSCCPTGDRCQGTLQCPANVCLAPVNIEGTASQVGRGCASLGFVNTAIGCIPFEIISQTARFFLAWGLSIGGGMALLLVGISALMLATSSGNPDKVNSAKSLFWGAITGLAFLVLSVFLLRFIGVDVLGLFR